MDRAEMGLVAVPTRRGEMLLTPVQAARLASGGVLDTGRGVIVGGAPAAIILPPGNRVVEKEDAAALRPGTTPPVSALLVALGALLMHVLGGR